MGCDAKSAGSSKHTWTGAVLSSFPGSERAVPSHTVRSQEYCSKAPYRLELMALGKGNAQCEPQMLGIQTPKCQYAHVVAAAVYQKHLRAHVCWMTDDGVKLGVRLTQQHSRGSKIDQT